MPFEAGHHDDPGQSLLIAKRKRDIKRHPVPDQIQAVHQLGVPAQFPAMVSLEADVSADSISSSATETAASHASPNLEMALSICVSLPGDGNGTPSSSVTA